MSNDIDAGTPQLQPAGSDQAGPGQDPAMDPPGQDAQPPAAASRRRWPWPLAATVVLAGGALAWWCTRWAEPTEWRLVVDERFDRPAALNSGWRAVLVPGYQNIETVSLGGSGWRIEGGVLVGDDHQGRVSNLARTDLPAGAMKASWRITPLISGLNLNCFVGAPNRLDGYTIHIGGWGRPDYVAIGRAPGVVLDACTLGEALRSGRTYAVAVEFDRGDLRVAIDGHQVLECRDPAPLAGSEQGGIGFEVNWNTVQIDDLQIWVRPPERLVSPLAAADTLASTGAWRRAAASYQSFVRTWPQDPLVPTARLRGAGSLLSAGFGDEALPILSELAGSPDRAIAIQARYERLRALAPRAPDDIVDGLIARLAEARPDATIGRLALTAASEAAFERNPSMTGEQVVALVGRIRGWAAALRVNRTDEPLARCAERLNRLGLHGEVINLMPESAIQHIYALLSLARHDELHRRFPDIQWARYMAWSDACRFEEGIGQLSEPFLRGRLIRESGVVDGDAGIASDFDQAFVMAQRQGVPAALERFPKETIAAAFAMLEAGRAAEVLPIEGITAIERGLALLQLGRLDEAAKVVAADAPLAFELHGCQAIAAVAAGDAARARRLAVAPEAFSWSYENRWASHAYDPSFSHHFAAFVLPALIAWQAAGEDPVPAWRGFAASQRQRSSLRVDHRWLGLLGAESEQALLDQPFRSGGHPAREAALVAAVRADLAGDPAAAARWTAYLAVASPFDIAARAWARQRLDRLLQSPSAR